MIYAGKEALQPFSATFPGHVEIFEKSGNLKHRFSAVKIRRRIF